MWLTSQPLSNGCCRKTTTVVEYQHMTVCLGVGESEEEREGVNAQESVQGRGKNIIWMFKIGRMGYLKPRPRNSPTLSCEGTLQSMPHKHYNMERRRDPELSKYSDHTMNIFRKVSDGSGRYLLAQGFLAIRQGLYFFCFFFMYFSCCKGHELRRMTKPQSCEK